MTGANGEVGIVLVERMRWGGTLKARSRWWLLPLLAALGLAAFPGSSEVSSLQKVRIGDSTCDWGFPNPYRYYPRGPSYVRMMWVFDTLVWKDDKGTVPGLADSWSYDLGRTAFSFQLNPRAKWHDGHPVTAEDVVYTFQYLKKRPYRWITLEHVDHVLAETPQTVVITLSRPYAPFLSEIGGTIPILPRHVWEKVDRPETYNL